jgi:hypothetical protein
MYTHVVNEAFYGFKISETKDEFDSPMRYQSHFEMNSSGILLLFRCPVELTIK